MKRRACELLGRSKSALARWVPRTLGRLTKFRFGSAIQLIVLKERTRKLGLSREIVRTILRHTLDVLPFSDIEGAALNALFLERQKHGPARANRADP